MLHHQPNWKKEKSCPSSSEFCWSHRASLLPPHSPSGPAPWCSPARQRWSSSSCSRNRSSREATAPWTRLTEHRPGRRFESETEPDTNGRRNHTFDDGQLQPTRKLKRWENGGCWGRPRGPSAPLTRLRHQTRPSPSPSCGGALTLLLDWRVQDPFAGRCHAAARFPSN